MTELDVSGAHRECRGAGAKKLPELGLCLGNRGGQHTSLEIFLVYLILELSELFSEFLILQFELEKRV